MKLNRLIFAILTTLAASILGFVHQGHAQISDIQPLWKNYTVRYVNDVYTSLAGSGTVIPNSNVPPINFVDSTGAIDMDNGTANDIPLGFRFEYNGTTAETINVNVNGWASINPINDTDPIPFVTSNNNNLFSSELPNNALAPYWGDHFYRTVEPGYTPSRISYETFAVGDTNPNAPPFSRIRIFYLEWLNLNVNDKTNPNSVASFQLVIIQNPLANDQTAPDERATIEFRYGTAVVGSTVAGAAVGANDSIGASYLNALFQTGQYNGDSTRLSQSLTTCWPPTNCTPGIAIQIVPLPANASVSMPVTSSGLSIQTYPNPLTQSATISFSSPESGAAEVTIVNLLGLEVARIFTGELESGEHSFTWNANGSSGLPVPPGVYWCVVRMNGRTEQSAMVVER
jgi:hypothetical protein